MALAMSTSTIALADDGIPGPEQDPYIFLEEARSPEALDWVAK
jgi:prolyl oligopeptidase